MDANFQQVIGSGRIRLARDADIAAMHALLDAVDDQHRAELPWLLRKNNAPRPPAELRDFLADENKVALVAEETGVVGLLLAYTRTLPDIPVLQPAKVAEIETLVVQPACRRRGYGKALVKAGIAWCEEQGASRVELGVYEFNQAAQHFWASVGFETLSRRMQQPLLRNPSSR